MQNIRFKYWIISSLATCAVAITIASTAWVRADQGTKQPLVNLSPQQQAAIESANHLSSAFRTVADQLLPAVVSIENRPKMAFNGNAAGRTQPSADPLDENPFEGTPFEDMFRGYQFKRPPMERRGMPGPTPKAGIGSGVIIDPAGIILTNNHVVAGGGEVTVRLHDGREFTAGDVWTDPKTDLAVVKIEGAEDLVAATLGDSDSVSIGDWVIALGQPFGLESTVTAGIISAKHRGIGITPRENFLQTDAAINPGNSGGPLVNLRGEVIGINTAIHSRSGGNDGIGFAIPSNLARWVGDQLASGGKVQRAYLGVGIQAVSQDLARQLGVKPRGGVAVTDVYPDTPAEKAGLKPGDVIVRFDGKEITSPQALQLAVERSAIGRELTIQVARNGKLTDVTYKAAEPEGEFAAKLDGKSSKPESKRMDDLGLDVAPLSSDVAKKLNLQGAQGVLVTSVRRDSPAARAGLKTGMLIVEVNRQVVTTVDQFQAAIDGQTDGDGILLLVRSESGSRFLVVKL